MVPTDKVVLCHASISAWRMKWCSRYQWSTHFFCAKRTMQWTCELAFCGGARQTGRPVLWGPTDQEQGLCGAVGGGGGGHGALSQCSPLVVGWRAFTLAHPALLAGCMYSKVALPRCGFGGGPRRRNSASAQSDAVSAYVYTACMYCTARTVWNRMYICTDCQYIRVHIRRPPRRTVPRPAAACTHQTQSLFPPPGRGRTKQDRPDWGATRFLHLPFCFLNGPLRMGLRSPQGRPSR